MAFTIRKLSDESEAHLTRLQQKELINTATKAIDFALKDHFRLKNDLEQLQSDHSTLLKLNRKLLEEQIILRDSFNAIIKFTAQAGS